IRGGNLRPHIRAETDPAAEHEATSAACAETTAMTADRARPATGAINLVMVPPSLRDASTVLRASPHKWLRWPPLSRGFSERDRPLRGWPFSFLRQTVIATRVTCTPR